MTPQDHADRVPLQLALTQLECLAESLNERKREAELRNKVKLLDSCTAQLNKVTEDDTKGVQCMLVHFFPRKAAWLKTSPRKVPWVGLRRSSHTKDFPILLHSGLH